MWQRSNSDLVLFARGYLILRVIIAISHLAYAKMKIAYGDVSGHNVPAILLIV